MRTTKRIMAMAVMLLAVSQVWAGTPYKNIHVALKASEIGVGKVYFTYDDDSPTTVKETDDEVDFKLTLGEDGNEVDNTSDLKGFYPLQLCATPKEGYRVRGFVTELKETYTDDDFLKGTYKDGAGDDDKHGKNNKYLLDEETGTLKVFVNVNIDQTTDGENNQAEVRGRNNWNENPDFTFYAIFEEGETKPIVQPYTYADGQKPDDCGTVGVIIPSKEPIYEDDDITLTAEPKPGCLFVKWVIDDGAGNVTESTEPIVSFKATKDVVYKAYFDIKPFTMSAFGVSTFSCPKAIQNDNIEFECYPAIVENGSVKLLDKLTGVPHEQGAILIGEANKTFELPMTWLYGEIGLVGFGEDNPNKYNKNELKNTALAPVTADGKQYVLANGSNGVGFYHLKVGEVIPQGKAYIELDEADAKDFLPLDGETTAIANMINPEKKNTVYNLQGQKVSDNYRGIVIMNGKKYFNK
ncbi:MAG: hypothetical protein IJ539_02730 [Prevotella sp.]|nr:hypothetical protein [Prevotella sp.]